MWLIRISDDVTPQFRAEFLVEWVAETCQVVKLVCGAPAASQEAACLARNLGSRTRHAVHHGDITRAAKLFQVISCGAASNASTTNHYAFVADTCQFVSSQFLRHKMTHEQCNDTGSSFGIKPDVFEYHHSRFSKGNKIGHLFFTLITLFLGKRS